MRLVRPVSYRPDQDPDVQRRPFAERPAAVVRGLLSWLSEETTRGSTETARAVLAALVHLSPSTLSRIERGVPPSERQVVSIARGLDWPEFRVLGLGARDLDRARSILSSSRGLVRKAGPVADLHRGILAAHLDQSRVQYDRTLGALHRKKGNSRHHARTVFLIHGTDEANVRALTHMLRRTFGLRVVRLALIAGRGRTIVEKFEAIASRTRYAIALMTKDDRVTDRKGRRYYQARPNVFLEIGWFLGKVRRGRVCFLRQNGSVEPSDIRGVQYSRTTSERRKTTYFENCGQPAWHRWMRPLVT